MLLNVIAQMGPGVSNMAQAADTNQCALTPYILIFAIRISASVRQANYSCRVFMWLTLKLLISSKFHNLSCLKLVASTSTEMFRNYGYIWKDTRFHVTDVY